MDKIPMVAFSNDELDKKPAVTAGQAVVCPTCGGRHVLQRGKEMRQDGTEVETDTLMFFTCEESGKSYLAAVNGKLVTGSA